MLAYGKQQRGQLLDAAGQNIRKLVKDGFVIKKPMKIHSRSRAREAQLAKSKGRHSGYGAQQTALLLLLAIWLAPSLMTFYIFTVEVEGLFAVWLQSYMSGSGTSNDDCAVLVVQVSGGVPARRGCRQRSCGSGGCASCAACSRSTATPRRSTGTCTTTCTSRWAAGQAGRCQGCKSTLPCVPGPDEQPCKSVALTSQWRVSSLCPAT
jgi:Ribosomal protein L19e